VDVHVIQEQIHLPIAEASVITMALDFIKYSKVNYDEVSIYFVDTKTICDLHSRFFNDPSPTDCISFPMDEASDAGYRVMGDVFVCPETASIYAQKHRVDPYKEITLYAVHGLLHLLGYDDLKEDDRKKMRAAEKRYLARVENHSLWIKPPS
jgi:probable rRNA maturation factor